MARLLYFLPLLLFSCLLAGLYGALFNQISYTVAPAYFHEFKFSEVGVDPGLQSRLGAVLIGAMASWWMGLILGLPLFLVGLLIRDDGVFWRSYLVAVALTVVTALLCGLAALGYAALSYTPASLPAWMAGREVAQPVAFARAGTMHMSSSLGGVVGAGIALGYMIAQAWRHRRS